MAANKVPPHLSASSEKKTNTLLLYTPHMSTDEIARGKGSVLEDKLVIKEPSDQRDVGVSWINLDQKPSIPRAAQSQGIHWDDVKYQKVAGNQGQQALVENMGKLEIGRKSELPKKDRPDYVPSVRPPVKVRTIPMPDECRSTISKRASPTHVKETDSINSPREMELLNELSTEQLPKRKASTGSEDGSVTLPDEFHNTNLNNLSDEELAEKVEALLLERINQGDEVLANFQLGQLYFEQDEYEKSRPYFQVAADKGDFQAMFQLAVIDYDSLGGGQDNKQGFERMLQVATTNSRRAQHLVRAAQYNVGKAFFQGYGVKQSDPEAERFWLLAADDGNPKASIKAQSVLGMFYSREESKDLKKAFFWHSEACGNGSLESQGALGVMYLHGLGCKKDEDSAFTCLRQSSERGNVFSMGNLISYYYKRKLYTKTVELAARVSQLESVEEVAKDTECLPGYVRKGIALGCFYYARCLHLGLGVAKSEDQAKTYYSKTYQFDPDVCAQLQTITQHGEI